MEPLVLLLLLHVLVIGAFVVARALHAKLAPLDQTRGVAASAAAVPGCDPATVLSGAQLEEYVRAGLVDLRIALVQAARRRNE